jgi:hypothetical protein
MELRQQQREEQAMEIRDTITETQQQQKHKNKNDKKRKKVTKTNHTTEWIQEWLVVITQLDGTGGHEELSKMAKQARGRHAQSLVNRLAATAMPALHDKNSRKHITTKRSILIQNRARQVH